MADTPTTSKAAPEPLSTIHLSARGCSRRAVKYRTLGPAMVSHIESQVSHSIDTKATSYDFADAVTAMALEQMIVAVTEPDVSPARYAGRAEKPGDPAPKPLEWRKVTPDDLNRERLAIFNAKDTAVLKRLYSVEHAVQTDEMEDILAGKVTTVAD